MRISDWSSDVCSSDLLGVYFHHCAIAMSCRQLAMAGRYLAFSGRQDGRTVLSPERARRINALMLMCGHYDGSGEFAFRVGIPGKSGVGGGILGEIGRAHVELQSLMRISYAVFCLKKKNIYLIKVSSLHLYIYYHNFKSNLDML